MNTDYKEPSLKLVKRTKYETFRFLIGTFLHLSLVFPRLWDSIQLVPTSPMLADEPGLDKTQHVDSTYLYTCKLLSQ